MKLSITIVSMLSDFYDKFGPCKEPDWQQLEKFYFTERDVSPQAPTYQGILFSEDFRRVDWKKHGF